MFTPDRSSLQSKTKGKVTQQQPVLMALCKYNAGSYTFVKQKNTACSLLPQVHSCVTKPQQLTLSRVTSKPCDLFPPPLILAATSYTQASKFQLSLKPTIYKLLVYTPLLEYVTHMIFCNDMEMGGNKLYPFLWLERLIHCTYIWVLYSWIVVLHLAIAISSVLRTVYKNGLKISKNQQPLLVQITLLSSVRKTPRI